MQRRAASGPAGADGKLQRTWPQSMLGSVTECAVSIAEVGGEVGHRAWPPPP